MSTAKERQAKRKAKIMADSELHQAQLKKDRERKKCQREAQREKMSIGSRNDYVSRRLSIKEVNETNEQHKPEDTVLLTASTRKSHEMT